MKPCEEYGHIWRCYRKDRLTNDENTTLILFFVCKVCGCKFDTADSDEETIDEKDYSEKKIFNGEEL
jgi:5-methylcytosine-specific restriction endonuclease McrA